MTPCTFWVEGHGIEPLFGIVLAVNKLKFYLTLRGSRREQRNPVVWFICHNRFDSYWRWSNGRMVIFSGRILLFLDIDSVIGAF